MTQSIATCNIYFTYTHASIKLGQDCVIPRKIVAFKGYKTKIAVKLYFYYHLTNC